MTTKQAFVSGLPGEPVRRRSLQESFDAVKKTAQERYERHKQRRHEQIRRVEGSKEADEAA